jgi:hypothetical protein
VKPVLQFPRPNLLLKLCLLYNEHVESKEHPGARWQRAARPDEELVDEQVRLRLAAMAGHIRHDMVAARRAALIDLLADGRPHRREQLWEAVEAQLNRDCWGARPAETLWRDLGALRAGGLRIAYARRAGVEGYYLQYPPIARQMTHPGEAVDVAHVTLVRGMSIAQKNRQAFAAAAFALQQKRLLLAREHPEWEEAQVNASARRLVYGRHEVP